MCVTGIPMSLHMFICMRDQRFNQVRGSNKAFLLRVCVLCVQKEVEIRGEGTSRETPLQMKLKYIELRSSVASSEGRECYSQRMEVKVYKTLRPLGSLEQNKTDGSRDSFPVCCWHWDSWMAICMRDHGEQWHVGREYSVPWNRRVTMGHQQQPLEGPPTSWPEQSSYE